MAHGFGRWCACVYITNFQPENRQQSDVIDGSECMSLSAGIAGLPNVGKSTLFNALCSTQAAAENYPFCTIEPNAGIVAVPDDRLRRITSIMPSQKAVPAFLELTDIAGLVKGASRGEGLGNQFLSHIRAVDALVQVTRCFDDSDVAHVEGTVDPVRDCETIETELLLKDLETVERALQRAAKAAKSQDKEALARESLLESFREGLEAGNPVRSFASGPRERAFAKEYGLLTAKKTLYIANVDENGYDRDDRRCQALEAYARERDARVVRICAKLEAEISELPAAEQNAFLQSMGLSEPALHTVARALASLLDLETFFTVSEKENRAWTVPRGTRAPAAAGIIHSDFEKGFICADVYRLEDLESLGSETALRAAGKMRQEGRDYIVADGDIIYFKFNV